MTLGERIGKALAYSGGKQAHLAQAVGVSAQAVGQWIKTSRVSKVHLPSIAEATGVRIRWLLTGELPMHGERIENLKKNYHSESTLSWVPLLEWNQVSMHLSGRGPDSKSYGQGLYYSGECADNSFALRVQGCSMTAVSGLSVPEGYVIVVDPELNASVTSGDLVLAWLATQSRIVFKQLALDDGQLCLRALNPQYPPVQEPFNVMGKIIEARLPF